MNNYPGNNMYSPERLGVRPSAQLSAGFLTQAFGWMFSGLLMTAAVSLLVQANAGLSDLVAGVLPLALIGEFAIVFAISLGINRLGATVALGLFFAYAAVNGFVFGLIFRELNDWGSVSAAFFSASAMFGSAAIYGAVTKRSLATLGGFLMMGLIGIIVALVVNLFIHSSMLGYVISIVGVIVFTGLTAYDTQRISQGQLAARLGSMEKAAVIGALQLYLDFINLFLMLLRLFSSQR